MAPTMEKFSNSRHRQSTANILQD